MTSSIVIPTRDRPHSLVGAVRSAVRALPPGGEVLVIDDAGTIPAASSLQGLVADNVRILRNPGPNGPSQARNFGVRQAKGKVVFFLDDDDEILPDYCKRVLSRSYPDNCAFGHCAPVHMEPDGQPTYHGRDQQTGIYGEEARIDDRLAGLGMGFWIDRDAFVRSGGIDTTLTVNEDTEFCIKLASLGYRSFYDSKAGVLLRHDHIRTDGDMPSITKSAKALDRALGFEYIVTKHQDYLRHHPRFRRLLLSRVIKYRSRARVAEGFSDFVRTLRPATDRLLMMSLGAALLRGSIAIRNMR